MRRSHLAFSITELLIAMAILVIIGTVISIRGGSTIKPMIAIKKLNEIEDIETRIYPLIDCPNTTYDYGSSNYCGANRNAARAVNLRDNENNIIIAGTGTRINGIDLRARCYSTGYGGYSETFYNRYLVEANLMGTWREVDSRLAVVAEALLKDIEILEPQDPEWTGTINALTKVGMAAPDGIKRLINRARKLDSQLEKIGDFCDFTRMVQRTKRLCSVLLANPSFVWNFWSVTHPNRL